MAHLAREVGAPRSAFAKQRQPFRLLRREDREREPEAVSATVGIIDDNSQGWTMQGDVRSADWFEKGGNPGGFFHWVDKAAGEDAFYVAPSSFLGHKQTLYGGAISYDIKSSAATYDGAPDVELVGANGTTLVATLGQPGTHWTHFAITLDADAGWHVGTLNGPEATKRDIKGVLADVDQFLIRAEYVDGPEKGGLDNVFMTKAPATSTQSDAEFPVHFELGSHSQVLHSVHMNMV